MNKEQLINILKELNFPIGDYYILSSACLMLYGLRDEITDIDLCISENLFNLIKKKYNLTEDKKNQCGFYKINDYLEVVVNEKEKMEYDMKDGFPVEKLTTILTYKLKRNAKKIKKILKE
ncbi:MAG: hypothetical protein GX247_05455 [Mollicutes bacterium]|nr:hypothetical protein [Mollicutes bacterium]